MTQSTEDLAWTYHFAMPASGSGPGVLVLHAWWGLNADIVAVCDNLATAGFVALAPSLYPNGAVGTTIAEAEVLRDAHDSAWESIVEIVDGSAAFLRNRPRVIGTEIGVLGYSLGAWWALNLSQRQSSIAAVAVFYGTSDGDYGDSKANYLGHYAEVDEYDPLEGVAQIEAAIREAGRDVQFHVYPGTGHWFAEPSRTDAFNAASAALAWERTVAFFHANLDD